MKYLYSSVLKSAGRGESGKSRTNNNYDLAIEGPPSHICRLIIDQRTGTLLDIFFKC
jgi:hypothetical protein